MSRMCSLGPPNTGRMSTNGSWLSEGPPRGLGTWAVASRGDTEGTDVVWLGEEQALGESKSSFAVPVMDTCYQKMESNSLLWCMAGGQRTTGTIWNETAFEQMKGKTFAPWEQSSSGTGYPKRLCSLCTWRFSSHDCIKPWTNCSDLMLMLFEQEIEIYDLWRFLPELFYVLKFILFSCTVQYHWLHWCYTTSLNGS